MIVVFVVGVVLLIDGVLVVFFDLGRYFIRVILKSDFNVNFIILVFFFMFVNRMFYECSFG